MVFDQYAGFVQKLPYYSLDRIDFANNKLIFPANDKLVFYDLLSNQTLEKDLPEELKYTNLKIFQNRLYVFFENKLSIYKILN